MTEHLNEEQLNEILDGYADSPAIQHADTCAECRAHLEELRAVLDMLESLPDIQLKRNLTASILKRLPTRGVAPAWKWLFATQVIGALASAAYMASSFTLPAEVATYQPPTFDAMLASILTFLASVSIEYPMVDFQVSLIDLQSTTILLFVISAAALWLVGNGLLLCRTTRRSR